MKQKYFFIVALFAMVFGVTTSCEDMLETESDRQIFDPALDQKTDSMFFTLGILKGVQQAIDQYVLVNEMRGDLVATNTYTETDLQELANFSAKVTNKYDSAYIYYRIINNCNYFIAHRDTSLRTGSRNVSMPEYVQAISIRAWAYMQLAKTYGSVPFYTEPVTNISEANAVRERKDLVGIRDALVADMEKYSGYAVPTYGDISAGSTNSGTSKTVTSSKMMFPIDVVLGDLYLETGEYENAAKHYFSYLVSQRRRAYEYLLQPYAYASSRQMQNLPNDMPRSFSGDGTWENVFSSTSDIVTYVPMAVNRLRGTVTDLPRLFGYDYYSTEASSSRSTVMYLLERQIDGSEPYNNLASAQTYFYVPTSATTDNIVKTTDAVGDLRRLATFQYVTKNDSSFNVMTKFNNANIPICRYTTVYLRLAEAINRMGYPDAAFAILKDGINRDLSTDTTYIKAETQQMLRTTLPFFSTENIEIFADNVGIHSYGSGHTQGTFTTYQMDTIVGMKIKELQTLYSITPTYTKADTINAVEDLICDEYALELAFEGYRFGDLCRLARHKNNPGAFDPNYGANFGGTWLSRKLAFKHPVVDLSQEVNWYLPFSK
ncbi:MAG: RagB/SusD family nutrient uptake outer membrane protein [Prevotella sp.]|nr:RagB/SusD family nutrient uptake outer membrane protein [Prevotella sp.]